MSRLNEVFKNLKENNKKAFSVFLMSGFPNDEIFLNLAHICADEGADFIEIGMPFSDPSADGEIIKKAGAIALKNNTTVKKTIDLIKKFRKKNNKTPIVWMGYFNSIFNYGVNKFINDINSAGVDGLITVDLPYEEYNRIIEIEKTKICPISLVAPTTSKERLDKILNISKGFVYFISITGITGTKEAQIDKIKDKILYLKTRTNLPVLVGFGIKNRQKADYINEFADGTITGSALIEKILKYSNSNSDKMYEEIREFIRSFKV